jgi:hypothetical protein
MIGVARLHFMTAGIRPIPPAANPDLTRRIAQVRKAGRPNPGDGLLVRRGRAFDRPVIAGGSGMRRIHSLRFEALESRELLSRAHAAAHAARDHAKPAVAGVPLVLDGTLTVDNNAASEEQNPDGSTTMSVPVTGQLGALGKVSGYWYESSDEFGDYEGPDEIVLRSSQGAFTVAFNNGSPGPAHRTGPHSVYYQHALAIEGGSAAYAGDTGSGTIDLNMNAKHTAVQSITLDAQSK